MGQPGRRPKAGIPKRLTEAEKAEMRLAGKVIRGRPPKGITLANFEVWDVDHGVVRDRDAERAAAERKHFGATPERAAKAGMVEVGKADRVQRVTDAPLDMLKARFQLTKDGKKDPEGNRLLFAVGDRFRQHWMSAGLTGLGAMDMGRVGSGEGHPAWATPTSEYAAHHRREVREAIAHMGDYLSKFVVAIVAEERALDDVGRSFTGRADRETTTAISIEVLRAGLTSLAWHWGMIRR